MSQMTAPPVLSTPDNHILSETEPITTTEASQRLSDEDLYVRYEIQRTVDEIRRNQWKRVALQFPDQMLTDSARVYQSLARGLHVKTATNQQNRVDVSTLSSELNEQTTGLRVNEREDCAGSVKLTILGDTSYGSCCVDEIAAEHIDADVVVHYGRSCLSPTARLPVIYVFTVQDLDIDDACESFRKAFPTLDSQVIITADTPFARHVHPLVSKLNGLGYLDIFAASILHDPSSLIPNRTVPDSVKQNPTTLKGWDLFHISDPPTSLLLTLSSRMRSVHIYPTLSGGGVRQAPQQANASSMLRRRYALITSLTTVSTWGILINTLSVKNYLHIVDHVRQEISKAGKKSYMFVVGKLNPAKVANFGDVDGWVVVGCWESSLVDSRDFFKPLITPFELDVVLAGDGKRVWTGEWRADFQGILDQVEQRRHELERERELQMPGAFVDETTPPEEQHDESIDFDSEEESAPPEFDLRTGRYVSHTRPMGSRRPVQVTHSNGNNQGSSTAIAKRSKGELLAVNGIVSPAAEYLAQKRTWRGLGSDFKIAYEADQDQGALVEEGRTGTARGYAVGESTQS